jgi:hypothetical protein
MAKQTLTLHGLLLHTLRVLVADNNNKQQNFHLLPKRYKRIRRFKQKSHCLSFIKSSTNYAEVWIVTVTCES